MRSKIWSLPLLALSGLLCAAPPAHAELVLMTSGRLLSVASHRIEGEQIILRMRNGGEISCDRALIEHILPDEIPYAGPPGKAEAADAGVADDSLASTPFGEIIVTMARAHGVDPMLVRAVIEVESGYRPRARSHRGAMGLMQLMPATARQYDVQNPYDPRANIAAGVMHLKSLIDRWGVELALAAYNAGEGAVKKFNGIPPYRETRNYVARILSLAGLK
jgi:soluble lytic murein transglycosylase-like protein